MHAAFNFPSQRLVVSDCKVDGTEKLLVLGQISNQACVGICPYGKLRNVAGGFVSREELLAVLESGDAVDFSFDDEGLSWRNKRVSLSQIESARRGGFRRGFGR